MSLRISTVKLDSPTKDKLLAAAEHLMLSKGFPATTVDDICEAAGFTKGSFFHYFKSKEQLGEEVLDRFFFSFQGRIEQGSYRKIRDPLKRVYGYVDRFIAMAEQEGLSSGCLLASFTLELSDTVPGIRSLCARRFAEWIAAFKQDLDEAKAEYPTRASFDTQSLAEHLITILEGSTILAKANQDPGVFVHNLQHFKRYLKMLFER
jgi:TetR/AcrR family transcriptional repressor of nem operon